MVEEKSITGFEEAPPPISEWRRFRRVFFSRGVVVFGLVVLVLLVLVAALASWIAPYDPYTLDMGKTLLQPCREHPLGTDALGRDLLSRLVYGTRIALLVGVIAVGAAATIGMTVGLIAAYFGGWASIILMRIVDSLMSFPMILLALLIAGMLGGGLQNVNLA